MYANLSAGMLIVLGTLIAVLGFLAGASMPMVLIGLGSITMGGILSVLDRRFAR